jgi:hypothetical protein
MYIAQHNSSKISNQMKHYVSVPLQQRTRFTICSRSFERFWMANWVNHWLYSKPKLVAENNDANECRFLGIFLFMHVYLLRAATAVGQYKYVQEYATNCQRWSKAKIRGYIWKEKEVQGTYFQSITVSLHSFHLLV